MAATRAVAPFNKFEIHVILIRLEDVCGKVRGEMPVAGWEVQVHYENPSLRTPSKCMQHHHIRAELEP